MPKSKRRTKTKPVLARFASFRRVKIKQRDRHREVRVLLASLLTGTALVSGAILYYHEVEAKTVVTKDSVIVNRHFLSQNRLFSFQDLLDDLINQDETSYRLILPREYLKLRADEEGVSYDFLNRIAYCESKWRMVQNVESSAFGYFQILEGTEKLTPQYRDGYRRFDPYINIDMAIYLFKKQGTLPWLESKKCWGA